MKNFIPALIKREKPKGSRHYKTKTPDHVVKEKPENRNEFKRRLRREG